MKRLCFVSVVILLLAISGCMSSQQRQIHQSLLLQENRRLENALYVTHAQLVKAKRENETLRNAQSRNGDSSRVSTPLLRPKREQPKQKNFDDAPLYEPPEIIVPEDHPGSTTLPDALKKSDNLLPPSWSPTR
jgi:hypothetical protein